MAEITKVSELTNTYLANYLRIDDADAGELEQIGSMLTSAKGFVSSYTGLPLTAPEGDADATTLDSKPEFVTAVCVLVQNSYDNRTFYVDKGEVEAVVNSILGMHRTNLL